VAKTYKTEGIILKRFDYGEADRILIIFSKHYGKLDCLAKGVRKLTSRKRNDIEPFSLTSLFLVSGKDLDLLAETQLINSFASINKDLKTTFLAWQLCELVDRLLPLGQENSRVFEILKQSLSRLATYNFSNDFMKEFKKIILIDLGFGLPINQGESSIDYYIENIIEKKINSKLLLKRIQ